MTDSQYTNAVDVQASPPETIRRFGLAVVAIGAIALVAAFVPVATIAALLTGLLGIAVGISCLVADRNVNLPALLGTFVSSAAVSLAIIMGMFFGA